jgi:hypothetical protein
MDPMCVAAVEIGIDGKTKVTPSTQAELMENGWRAMLIKVINRAGHQSRLRIDSPNARPILDGPLDDIPNRWLGLSTFDGRPLSANLSGLELEYRIVQLFSTAVGEAIGKAMLELLNNQK